MISYLANFVNAVACAWFVGRVQALSGNYRPVLRQDHLPRNSFFFHLSGRQRELSGQSLCRSDLRTRFERQLDLLRISCRRKPVDFFQPIRVKNTTTAPATLLALQPHCEGADQLALVSRRSLLTSVILSAILQSLGRLSAARVVTKTSNNWKSYPLLEP